MTSTAKAVRPAVAVLPEVEQRRAKAEWPFEVGLVPIRNLIVDDRYQRPPAHDFIARMAADFDPTLVGTIDVSHRGGRGGAGEYAILDGQQRFFTMQQVGKTSCWCSIYSGMEIADEAGFFYRKNKDRKAMKPYYSFRARMLAGDEEARQIHDVVEAEGFVLGPNTNDAEVIGAIKAIEVAYGFQSEHREESLSPTLATIRASFKGRKNSLDSLLIQGIARFWQAFGDNEVELTRLSGALEQQGPTAILGAARDAAITAPRRTSGGVSLPWLVARKVGETYNKAVPTGNAALRLDLKRFA